MVEPLKLPVKRICRRAGCAKEFVPWRPQHVYCSDTCKMTDYNMSHDIAGRMKALRLRRAEEGRK